MLDFSDKRYTDVMSVYDKWNQYDAIMHTMKNRGLDTCTIEEFIYQANMLHTARRMYPDLPLDEAFRVYDGTGIITSISSKNILAAQSKGLGDTIAKVTHATGLDKLSHLYTQITGKPCGCPERQDALNKLFPYGVKENG
jgi:hypothetical protein